MASSDWWDQGQGQSGGQWQAYHKPRGQRAPSLIPVEILVGAIASIAILLMVWVAIFPDSTNFVLIMSASIFIACVIAICLLVMSPDALRARQTDATLRMSREMVDIMASGMTPEAAQAICQMLLPNTAAIAVAITDRMTILGYVGYREAANPQGAEIRTQATHDVINDGKMRILRNAEDIGLPKGATMIKAAIIVPIRIGKDIRGTLKFYYRNPYKITETQKSIAQGLGALFATQLAATELEKQRELATSMELKMLQGQINPHFLFNTINTIASLIRTDAPKARVLLRDFAVFYRSTLENSQDQIPLSKEVEQTQRYFSFEMARFGEDRLALEVDMDDSAVEVSEMLVPPFLLQPLVENSVKHAMPAEGRLTISIRSEIDGDDIVVSVADNGVGMTDEQCENIFHPNSQTGLGIAVKNVRDRMLGYYGPEAEMAIKSTLGVGTSVRLRFPGMADELLSRASDGDGCADDGFQLGAECDNGDDGGDARGVLGAQLPLGDEGLGS